MKGSTKAFLILLTAAVLVNRHYIGFDLIEWWLALNKDTRLAILCSYGVFAFGGAMFFDFEGVESELRKDHPIWWTILFILSPGILITICKLLYAGKQYADKKWSD